MIKFINPHQTWQTLQQLAINTNQAPILITELITEIFGGYKARGQVRSSSSQEMNGGIASIENKVQADFKSIGEAKCIGKVRTSQN